MASHGGLRAFVFAAACTGSARLSALIGLPLVHIAVTTNRDAEMDPGFGTIG